MNNRRCKQRPKLHGSISSGQCLSDPESRFDGANSGGKKLGAKISRGDFAWCGATLGGVAADLEPVRSSPNRRTIR